MIKTSLLLLLLTIHAHAYQLHAEMALPRMTISTDPNQPTRCWYNTHGIPVYVRRLQSGFFPPADCSAAEMASFLSGYTVMSVRLPYAIGYDKLLMDTGVSPHGSTVTLEPDYMIIEPGQYISIDISPYYLGLNTVQVELVIWWTAEP